MASSVSELTRMAGLVSGLDTEALVKAATARTNNAINAKKQKLQSLQWKQEAYREVISAFSDFQTKYLDILSKSSIRSNSVMKAHKATSSDESLSVTASANAVDTKYEITSVQTAKAAEIKGQKASAGTVELDFSKASEGNNTVKITLDGAEKKVTFKGGANAKENFLRAVNDTFKDISNAEFSFKDGTNKLTIENAADDKVSHVFTIAYSDAVGLENDGTNRISTSSKLGSVDFAQELVGDRFEFSINGVDFSFDKNTSIKDVMNTVNKSNAGVTMSFSSLSQSFTLATKETGAGKEIAVSQKSGNLVNALFNMSADEISTEPTTVELASVTPQSGVSFSITVPKTGFTADDSITVNGKKLSISGISEKQEASEIIKYNNKDVYASKYTDSNGDVFKFVSDNVTHYARRNGDQFEDIITVENGTVYDENNNVISGKSEADILDEKGITRKMHEYSASDIQDALNSAYKASFGDGGGSFSVSVFADTNEAKVTFTPAAGEAVSISGEGNVKVSDTGYTDKDGAASNYTRTPFDPAKEIALASKVTFKVNGNSEITVNGTGDNGLVTIKDLTDTGYFSYDEATGKFAVVGKNQLEATEGADAIEAAFGTKTLVGEGNTGKLTVHGSNAQATINGVTLESATNSFIVDGTTFGIEGVKEFNEDDIAAGDAEAITVKVEKDNSKIKETILAFVEDYNKLLDTINEQLTTERPKSKGEYFDPLTEEQEEEMEQTEIDKWNEKAKQGLLYHDSTLSKVFTSIRSAINASVDGMTIQALGIDTSDDYADYGKLEIKDESVLDSAIDRFGDEISTFFTDTEKGLGASLNNAVNMAIDKSISKNGYPKGMLTSVAGIANTRSAKNNYIYNQLNDLQTMIDKLKTRYENEQTRYWKQYSTLETYINTMNSQQTSIFGTTLSGASQ